MGGKDDNTERNRTTAHDEPAPKPDAAPSEIAGGVAMNNPQRAAEAAKTGTPPAKTP